MFELGYTQPSFLTHVQQPLLKGMLFVETEQVVQTCYAVRIPGGITPP